jgi:undecaprenyl-diphosphatase
MNAFDLRILRILNGVGDSTPTLTTLIVAAYQTRLSAVLLTVLFWWAWFSKAGGNQQGARERIASCFGMSVPVLFAARALAIGLPFRSRPAACADALGLHFPFPAGEFVNWSAFPSDHALLFFFLATCLFHVSRVLGILAFVDAALLISFPRVFVGVHYPTDVLGGALFGIVAGWAIMKSASVNLLASRTALRWEHWHAPSFYASAFLFSYLLSQIFWPVFHLIQFLKTLVGSP